MPPHAGDIMVGVCYGLSVQEVKKPTLKNLRKCHGHKLMEGLEPLCTCQKQCNQAPAIPGISGLWQQVDSQYKANLKSKVAQESTLILTLPRNSPAWWAEGQFLQGTSCYYQYRQEEKENNLRSQLIILTAISLLLVAAMLLGCFLQYQEGRTDVWNQWSALKAFPLWVLLSVHFTCSRTAKQVEICIKLRNS